MGNFKYVNDVTLLFLLLLFLLFLLIIVKAVYFMFV